MKEVQTANGSKDDAEKNHGTSRAESTPNTSEDAKRVDKVKERRPTAYERLSLDLTNDERCLKEITLGKRIGFYRIRGELGTGNFSQVKMGIHALTKGMYLLSLLMKREHRRSAL